MLAEKQSTELPYIKWGINPSFSYPGGIWINERCSQKCYKLLLEFVAITPEKWVRIKVEKQEKGTLIRFNSAQAGLNCFNYIIDNLQ